MVISDGNPTNLDMSSPIETLETTKDTEACALRVFSNSSMEIKISIFTLKITKMVRKKDEILQN